MGGPSTYRIGPGDGSVLVLNVCVGVNGTLESAEVTLDAPLGDRIVVHSADRRISEEE